MTLDEIDKLTIADIRAINERAAAALATLKELGLIGGAAGAQPGTHTQLAPVVPPTLHGNPTRTRTPLGPGEAEDLAAQRAALLSQNRDLPDDIKKAEGIS